MPIKVFFNASCARHIDSKTDVPDLGNEQNDLKTLFPMLGTRKNIKNDCSQHWEAPKMRKTRVPKVGNTCFVSFTGHHDRKY
jgi:hypothetical protein